MLEIYNSYPPVWQAKTLFLRELILDVASELPGIDQLQETTKWGEPSYIAKSGSTIRVAWLKSKPNKYGIYFNCKTKLIDTFRELYKDKFKFEGNRAIVFNQNDVIPVKELKRCISLALTYHLRKNTWMLGA